MLLELLLVSFELLLELLPQLLALLDLLELLFWLLLELLFWLLLEELFDELLLEEVLFK